MARVDQRSYPHNVRPEDQVRLGPETLAIIAALDRLADAMWDTQVVSNAPAFARMVPSVPKTIDPPANGITAASAEVAYENQTGRPVVVFATVGTPTDGTGAGTWLTMALDEGNTGLDLAPARDFDSAPKVWLVVPAGASAWVNASSPDGSGATVQVMISVIPLSGRRPYMSGG